MRGGHNFIPTNQPTEQLRDVYAARALRDYSLKRKKIELQFAGKFNLLDLVGRHVFLVYLDESLLDKSRDCTAFSW